MAEMRYGARGECEECGGGWVSAWVAPANANFGSSYGPATAPERKSRPYLPGKYKKSCHLQAKSGR